MWRSAGIDAHVTYEPYVTRRVARGPTSVSTFGLLSSLLLSTLRRWSAELC